MTNNIFNENYPGYKFIKDLRPQLSARVKTGLYSDNRKHKVVIKNWQGKIKDISYLNLKSETNSLASLNSIYDREYSKLPQSLKFVKIPKIYQTKNSLNQLTLISEYKAGKPLSDVKSVKSQHKFYRQVLSFLDFLSKKATPREIKLLRRKTLPHYLCIFPLIWITAVIQNIKLFPLLLKVLPIYLITGLSNLDQTRTQIVHGDLNFKNVLVSQKEISLIDCEQTCFTFPEFELASSISALNTPQSFKDYIIKTIISKSRKSQIKKNQLTFALLNCHLHNLTWHAPAVYVEWYKKQLYFALDMYINKYV